MTQLRSVLCSCGQRHAITGTVAKLMHDFGENVQVRGRTGEWWVPAVYIAVHGRPGADDLRPLARKFGWSPVRARSSAC